jgi:hypothetical protein
VYAHCQRGAPGGVALLAINTDRLAARALILPVAGARYTLSADALESDETRLNGTELRLGPNDDLPRLEGMPTAPGPLTVAPATIAFVTMPGAANAACR